MAAMSYLDKLIEPIGLTFTIAPFGAVCVVLFAAPNSPAAKVKFPHQMWQNYKTENFEPNLAFSMRSLKCFRMIEGETQNRQNNLYF